DWSSDVCSSDLADWKLTMIGLDITDSLRFNQDFLDELEQSNAVMGGFVNKISQFYMDFYSKGQSQRECRFHDVITLAYVLHPEWFETELCKVMVSTDELTRGQTVCCPKGRGINEPC